MKRLFQLFTFFVLIAACSSPLSNQLMQVEQLMDDRPDSTLLILSKIEGPFLSEKDEAKYALLLSQAYDKNYIDLVSDSLIRIAVDYYKVHGSEQDRMKAWFYLGRIQQNAYNNTDAIISFNHTLEIAEKVGDYYYAGMANQNISNLYCRTYNKAESIYYSEQSVKDFSFAGKEMHREYALLWLAICYFNAGESEKGELILRDLIAKSDNDVLIRECKRNLGAILMKRDSGCDPEQALSLFREGGIENLDVTDLGYYAVACNILGMKDSTFYYLDQAYQLCEASSDSAIVSFHNYQIEYANGKYKEACENLRRATRAQDSLIRFTLQESITTALKNYYREESLFEKEQLKNQGYRNSIIIGILVLSIILTILFFIHRNEREKKQTQYQMDLLISDNLKIHKENAALAGSLFQERFTVLNELSEHYFSEEDDARRNMVYKEFRRYLRAARNDEELFKNLEETLDRFCDGLITKFKKQIPGINNDNLKICELFFAGMSYEKVMTIMNRQSIGSLRTLKSRLRCTIKESGAPDTEAFLSYL